MVMAFSEDKSFKGSKNRLINMGFGCQMAALYILSGTASGTVCERLSALRISLMHLEDGAWLVLVAAMVTGLN
jgi:hypothetical protein